MWGRLGLRFRSVPDRRRPNSVSWIWTARPAEAGCTPALFGHDLEVFVASDASPCPPRRPFAYVCVFEEREPRASGPALGRSLILVVASIAAARLTSSGMTSCGRGQARQHVDTHLLLDGPMTSADHQTHGRWQRRPPKSRLRRARGSPHSVVSSSLMPPRSRTVRTWWEHSRLVRATRQSGQH